MTEAEFAVLEWLVVAVALLVIAIFIPIVANFLKKDKASREIEKAVDQESLPVTEKAIEVTQATPGPKSIWGRLSSLSNMFGSDQLKSSLDEVEEILYTSDFGPKTTERLMAAVQEKLGRSEQKNIQVLREALKSECLEIFAKTHLTEPTEKSALQFLANDRKPTVWMIVGVNGAGKTTTLGKMAALAAESGKKVLIAAGDTFRAAAEAQLKVWSDRAQVEIFSPTGVKDPAAVAFDAIQKAKANDFDLVLIDTAGRLHTQAPLMEELKKVARVIQKADPTAPHEKLIVLDANSGQNAFYQAKEFHAALQLTGVVLTKMDGTAKGGVAVGIANELSLPIRILGIGEKLGDLKPFSAQEFVDSIL